MKDLHYSSRVFDSQRYDSDTDLWENIKIFCRSLIRDGYNVLVRYEDAGVYVVEFDHSDPDLANSLLMWVSPEEADVILDSRSTPTKEDSDNSEDEVDENIDEDLDDSDYRDPDYFVEPEEVDVKPSEEYHSYEFSADDLSDEDIKDLRKHLYKAENAIDNHFSYEELEDEFAEFDAFLKQLADKIEAKNQLLKISF